MEHTDLDDRGWVEVVQKFLVPANEIGPLHQVKPSRGRREAPHLRELDAEADERALERRGVPDRADDVDALATRYELAGGYIRNAALRAAYLAAAAGSVITAPIVERAVALEYHDAGKLSTGGRLS